MKKKYFFILPGVISILLMGSILTILSFQYIHRGIEKSIRHQKEKDSDVYTGIIDAKIKHYITLMDSLNNLFQFSEFVTRDEFAGFTSMLLSREPGMKMLCWVPQVEPDKRVEYEMAARKEGFVQYSFHSDMDLSRLSGVLYPIYYVEPMAQNQSLFGLVLNDQPLLSEAFESSLKSGRMTSVVNPLTTSAKNTDKPRNDCWIVLPVFEKYGLKVTEQGRRQGLEGYLLGIFDVSAMMDHVLSISGSDTLPLKFHIEDITGGYRQMFITPGLVCCRAGMEADRHNVVMEKCIEFADRTWKIYCVSDLQDPMYRSQAWIAWMVFPAGMLLTGLLILYLYTLYCRNELAAGLVEKRTRELKEQKEKADAIAIEAERSNRAKSAFLAGMSHDIRTPMNVILGFCELLAEESLSKDQKYYVQTIHGNSKNLLMLLNDILDLSKIEAGKLHLDLREFDPQEMLESIESTFRASTQNRGLDFRIIFMTHIPRLIRSDPLRIRQCLVNLIGNAIKFTHQGHIYVSVCHEQERLKLIVEDTGIGIPQERLESIFNVFGSSDRGGDSEDECGSGLGLAVTRQLARLMEGDVTVVSQKGKGSVFTLDIPAGSAQDNLYTVFQETGHKDGWGEI